MRPVALFTHIFFLAGLTAAAPIEAETPKTLEARQIDLNAVRSLVGRTHDAAGSVSWWRGEVLNFAGRPGALGGNAGANLRNAINNWANEMARVSQNGHNLAESIRRTYGV